jgi:hypothetical protein
MTCGSRANRNRKGFGTLKTQLGYFLYGKKQRAIVPLLCGLTLMGIPYLIDSSTVLVVSGAVLAAIPYFVRL